MKLDYTSITRQNFMDFFRDDKMLNLLSNDDRLEIFSQILPGSSDITKMRVENLLRDYSFDGVQVLEF